MAKTIIFGQTLQAAERIQRILNLPDALVLSAYQKQAGRGLVADLLIVDAAIKRDRYNDLSPIARLGNTVRVEVLTNKLDMGGNPENYTQGGDR